MKTASIKFHLAKSDEKIFGYDWEQIQSAQQGNENFRGTIDTSKPAVKSYYCDRCQKYSKPANPIELGIQCKHCGFVIVP